MPISLNPQEDTLFVPVKLYKEFTANLAKTYTDEKLKNEVKIEESKIPAVKQKIIELNEDAKKLKDDFPHVIFHLGWNKKFDSEKESGEKLFEFLKKNEINQLQTKAEQEHEKTKVLFSNIAKAAKAAVDEMDNALKAYKVLNEATDAANIAAAAAGGTPAPAGGTATAQPAPQPKTKSALAKVLIDNFPASKSSFEDRFKNPNGDMDGPLEDFINTQRKTNAKFNQDLKAAGFDFDKESPLNWQGEKINFRTYTSENINKSLILTKKLYEVGFIDRSEYLAALVKTKKLLEAEATPPQTAPQAATAQAAPQGTPATPQTAPTTASTGAPAAGADSAKARQEFGTLIANTGNTNSKMNGYMNQLGVLQKQTTELSQGKLNENRKKLIKSLIKKRILEETIKQRNKKEYLNEFLVGLLVAAAAAIGAWIGKKFAEYFSRGPAVSYQPDSRNTKSDDDFDEEDMAGLLDKGATDASTGKVFSKDGRKPLNPEENKIHLQTYIGYINNISTLYAENLQKLTTTLPACNYDPANKTVIENALNAIPKTLEQGKTVISALDAYIKS